MGGGGSAFSVYFLMGVRGMKVEVSSLGSF